MLSGFSNAFKGLSGEYELQRVLGGFGTVVYTVVAPTFVALGTIKNVSLTEFALSFPAGLAACIGATAGAIALKDRNTATSKVIAETGAIPAKPPAGPKVPVEPEGER